MCRVDPEIRRAQIEYALRPFAVRWVDSHFSGTFRFQTFREAFDYVQAQWAKVQERVATTRHRASNLRESYLETPLGKISLRYWLMADDVSSYH